MAKEKTEKRFKIGDHVIVDGKRHAVVEEYYNKHYVCEFDDGTVDAYTGRDLKPAKLRPWMPEEIPSPLYLGKIKYYRDHPAPAPTFWCHPERFLQNGVVFSSGFHSFSELKDNWVWSDRPFGEERPCGVWVENGNNTNG